MLTGLCHWHSKTQETLLPVVGELHSLEQVASDQHIGTLAENLLEAMMENDSCKEEVSVWFGSESTWADIVHLVFLNKAHLDSPMAYYRSCLSK